MTINTGVNISKGGAYAVLSVPTGVNISKGGAYAVLSVPRGVNVGKLAAYAVIEVLQVTPLDGSAAGSASASGVLDVISYISGDAAGAASAMGDLSGVIGLEGSATSSANVDGSLTLPYPLLECSAGTELMPVDGHAVWRATNGQHYIRNEFVTQHYTMRIVHRGVDAAALAQVMDHYARQKDELFTFAPSFGGQYAARYLEEPLRELAANDKYTITCQLCGVMVQ